MKKTYIKPNVEVVKVNFIDSILTLSGVETGGTPNNEYHSGDPTLSRETQAWDIWGDGMDDDFDE